MKPIKVAIASYGLSGEAFHAPFLDAHPDFELIAIGERSKDRFRARYPHVQRVTSFEELIALPELELVVVNTPDPTHYQYVKSALEAGRHVVVEKPMVETPDKAEELIALAKSKNLLLTVYQNRRLDGDFLTIRQLIREGKLGRVVEFNTAFERFRQPDPSIWKDRSEGRVGLIYNLGSHAIDQAVALFGMPERLWATADVMREGGQVLDYYQITLIYPRLRCNLRATMTAREQGPNFSVHGTEGSFQISCIDPQEGLLRQGIGPTKADPRPKNWGTTKPEDWGILHNNDGRAPYPALAGDYMHFYDNIRDVLRQGAEPEVTHSEMIDLIRLLDAVYRSAQSGQCVTL